MNPTRRIGHIVATLALAAILPAACAYAGGENKDIRLGSIEPNAKAEGTIRLATYNLLNLFDNKDDPALSGRNDDMSSIKFDEEKEALGKIFKSLDADIVALQEIESLEALTEFRDEYLQGLGYDHIVSIDVGQERGIENAVLSRYPITDHKVWPQLPLGGIHPEKYGNSKNWNAGKPIVFRRSPLRVTVQVPSDVTNGPAYDLTLFVVHHKSGRHSGYWRDKEAEKVCELIKEFEAAHDGANIAVLGDFNATYTDHSVMVYAETAGCGDIFNRNDPKAAKMFTHESNRVIDFILANDALHHELAEDSGFVLGTPLRPSGADYRTDPAPEGYASDHLPVVIDLTPSDK